MMRRIDVTTGLIALGSNLKSGDLLPARAVLQAMDRVAAVCGGEAVCSSLYQTPAFPAGSGPDFVNAAREFAIDIIRPGDALQRIRP